MIIIINSIYRLDTVNEALIMKRMELETKLHCMKVRFLRKMESEGVYWLQPDSKVKGTPLGCSVRQSWIPAKAAPLDQDYCEALEAIQ